MRGSAAREKDDEGAGRRRRADAPLVWVINTSQTDVLLVLEETVEVRMMSMESEFGKKELDVGSDERAIAWYDIRSGQRLSDNVHTR